MYSVADTYRLEGFVSDTEMTRAVERLRADFSSGKVVRTVALPDGRRFIEVEFWIHDIGYRAFKERHSEPEAAEAALANLLFSVFQMHDGAMWSWDRLDQHPGPRHLQTPQKIEQPVASPVEVTPLRRTSCIS